MTDLPPAAPSPQPLPDRALPAPPPLPPMPLSYSSPTPSGNPGKATFHQQAAKASWLAPIIAFGINFLSNQGGRQPNGATDRWTVIVVGIINGCLILAGLVLGIIALFGIRTQGKQKILTPAIVGISLNGILLAFGVVAFVVISHISRGAPGVGSAAARPPITAQEASDSITKSPGWVGEATRGEAVVVVISVPAGTPLSTEIADAFGSNRLGFVVTVSNARGTEPITVNAADFSVVLKDGSTHAALPPEQVFAAAAATFNVPQLRSAYPAAATLAAGAVKEASVAAFLPSDVDPAQIDHAVILFDGKPLTIPGKFLSAEEKAANHARSQAAQNEGTR